MIYCGACFSLGMGLGRRVLEENILLLARGQLPVICHQYSAFNSLTSSFVILVSIKIPLGCIGIPRNRLSDGAGRISGSDRSAGPVTMITSGIKIYFF